MIQRFAKKLRQDQTTAEAILWHHIRNQQIPGLKFRRQHIILNYIVDFYCVEKHLAIEVDGGIHSEPGHSECDQIRQKEIESLGITLLRFTNDEVKYQLPDVLEEIFRLALLQS